MNLISKITLLILFILIINTTNAKDIYETDFYHIEITTDNATKTKYEQIQKIKNISFLKILDKILTSDNKKLFIQKVKYKKNLENIIQNIIIEKELITKNKYIADIKINFIKKEIIYLLRNNKINYSDINSGPFLLISSYEEEFATYGLTHNNIFYDNYKLNTSFEKNLLNIKIPDLNPNDRYIIPYKKIIDDNIEALSEISNKYNVKNIIVIKIYKNITDNFELRIYYFSNFDKKLEFINDLYLADASEFYNNIYLSLNDWWKKNNIINNKKMNKLVCKIKSVNFSDLINIKRKIVNLSQFKSIKILSISYNSNLEKIEFYGDQSILKKSLLLEDILIDTKNNCVITKLK